uniref:CHAP domain containing protein n=1 Tax=Sphingobacterium sp. (strain 21) TaxID=743722 RepID=F4C2C9_SPHS2
MTQVRAYILCKMDDKYLLKAWPIVDDLPLAQRAMHIMLAQVGLKEEGNNQGHAVKLFLKSTGLSGGYAWCMAFVYWAFGEAAEELGVENPLIKTAGVLRQWNEISPEWKHTRNPEVGDIFIMDFGGGSGHTGMVTKVEDKFIHTIEGNTNAQGSRNGDGVYERVRNQSTIKGYIRVPE